MTETHGYKKIHNLARSEAKAEVLAFLDSNVECTPGWLEPLLETVNTNRSDRHSLLVIFKYKFILSRLRIAVPVLDDIDPINFRYTRSDNNLVAAFLWDLGFVVFKSGISLTHFALVFNWQRISHWTHNDSVLVPSPSILG